MNTSLPVYIVLVLLLSGTGPRSLAVQACQGRLPVASKRLRLDERLWAVIGQKNSAAVSALLRQGADPNARSTFSEFNPRGATMLMLAAALGDVPTMRLLLTHGASVNARGPSLYAASRGGGDFRDSNALIEACLRDDDRVQDAVMLLVQHGADVNAHDRAGTTPLSAAIWTSDWSVAQLLLRDGARSTAAQRQRIRAGMKVARSQAGLP